MEIKLQRTNNTRMHNLYYITCETNEGKTLLLYTGIMHDVWHNNTIEVVKSEVIKSSNDVSYAYYSDFDASNTFQSTEEQSISLIKFIENSDFMPKIKKDSLTINKIIFAPEYRFAIVILNQLIVTDFDVKKGTLTVKKITNDDDKVKYSFDFSNLFNENGMKQIDFIVSYIEDVFYAAGVEIVNAT